MLFGDKTFNIEDFCKSLIYFQFRLLKLLRSRHSHTTIGHHLYSTHLINVNISSKYIAQNILRSQFNCGVNDFSFFPKWVNFDRMNTQVSYFTHYQVNEKKKVTPGFNVLCHKFYNSWVSSIIKVKDKRFSSDCRPYQIEQSYME